MLWGHFEKAVLSGGHTFYCSVSQPFLVCDTFCIFTYFVTPTYCFFNTGTYDIITIMITEKCYSRKIQQTPTTFFTTKIDRMANFEIRG